MLILLLWLVPFDDPCKPIVDEVQVFEYNRYWCPETGRLILTQFIFWDKHVVHWEMEKPYHYKGNNAIRFFNNTGFREIRFKVLRESNTYYDPEVEDRAKLDKDCRRGLKQ